MSERYARNIVYVRWVPGDQFRPVESFDELAAAINRADELAAGGRGPTDVKVIDLENLDLGDMRRAALVIATVQVHTDDAGVSRFKCPNCERTIRYTNTFPLGFDWKLCPKCRWVWARIAGSPIGPVAVDLAGQTNDVQVVSTGEPTPT
jgi:hypothetical protein